jgi:flagellar hook-associated protein 2
LRGIVTGVVSNGSSGLTRLNQVGVSFQKDGTLALDATKLQSAINTQFNQLSNLFAATGSATDAQLTYASSTSATKPGSYAVSVSQMATQGSWLGQSLGSNPISITAGSNDSLQVTLDSIQATITLAPGSYSASALAATVQARINGTSAFSNLGSAITASISSNSALSLLSTRYGSGSNISLSGSAASALLGGSGGVSASTSTGLDMQGTLNGQTVSNSGQYLTGATGDAAEGLKVNILGGGTGSRGNVRYTQGFAYQIDQLAASLLSDTGLFASRTDSVNQALKRLTNATTREQARLTTVQASYQKQFSNLDTIMSKMNSTSSYLSQQLTALAKSGGIA